MSTRVDVFKEGYKLCVNEIAAHQDKKIPPTQNAGGPGEWYSLNQTLKLYHIPGSPATGFHHFGRVYFTSCSLVLPVEEKDMKWLSTWKLSVPGILLRMW